MNQIKYLVYAFLIFFCIVAGVLLIDKISSSTQTIQQTAVIENDNPAPKNVVIDIEGQKLFQANCAKCHPLHTTDNLLINLENRGPWTDRKNLIKWIKNPAATTNEFPYTKAMVEQFNGLMMPSFLHLTESQIEAILDYIKASEFVRQ